MQKLNGILMVIFSGIIGLSILSNLPQIVDKITTSSASMESNMGYLFVQGGLALAVFVLFKFGMKFAKKS